MPSTLSLEHMECYNIIVIGKYIYILNKSAEAFYHVYKIVVSYTKITASSWHLNGFPQKGSNIGSTV